MGDANDKKRKFAAAIGGTLASFQTKLLVDPSLVDQDVRGGLSAIQG